MPTISTGGNVENLRFDQMLAERIPPSFTPRLANALFASVLDRVLAKSGIGREAPRSFQEEDNPLTCPELRCSCPEHPQSARESIIRLIELFGHNCCDPDQWQLASEAIPTVCLLGGVRHSSLWSLAMGKELAIAMSVLISLGLAG